MTLRRARAPALAGLLLALLPTPGRADEHLVTRTLAGLAEDLCIPGAAPLPLDLFSFTTGPLGQRTVTVELGDDGEPIGGTIHLADDPGTTVPLGVEGFATLELLLSGEIDFTIAGHCAENTLTFTLTTQAGVRLKPDFLSAAERGVDGKWVKIEDPGPVDFGPVDVGVEVVYTVEKGAPDVRFVEPFGLGAGGGAGDCGAGMPLDLVLPAGAGGFMIGSTGVVVEGATLVLGPGPSFNLCEVDLGFGGILSFLEEYAGDFAAENLKLEGRGFTGAFTFGRADCDPAGGCYRSTTLLGNDFCFQRLRLAFRENAVTEASICGGLRPPFFAEYLADCSGYLDLELSLQADGEVRVAFQPCLTPLHLGYPRDTRDVFDLEVTNLDFELAERGGYRIRLDGNLTLGFIDDPLLGGAAPIEVAVRGLTVTADGEVSLDGGWVRLPEPETFRFQGFFEVTVRGISFGRDATHTWVGLDADMSLMEGLPLGGSVQGFRVLWPNEGGDLEIDIGGIDVDFELAGVVSFQGALGWDGECFGGRVFIDLEAIHFAADATLVVGRDEDAGYRFFYVKLGTELPAGIPIFPGVSLYGLEGLFASNLAPTLDEFEAPLLWYREHQDWNGECSTLEAGEAPWRPERGALAFGAGALIGSADDGFAVHAKATLLISIPGPLISFEGKGNILTKRKSFLGAPADEPIFHAYAIVDSDFFEIGVGINYELASVLKIQGEAEAAFNLKEASDWHVYLGNVSGRQIEATVVEFLKSKAFYMIHPEECDLLESPVSLARGVPDLAFGASIGFDKDYSAGPLGIALRALIAGWVAINFAPIHFQGGMTLDGAVELRAFGFSLGIATLAELAFQTPTPFILDGLFRVKMKLPWPLPDPEAEVRLRWAKDRSPAPVSPLLKEVQLTARDGTGGVAALLLAAGDPEPDLDSLAVPIVELDQVPNLIFRRPMNDRTPGGYGGAQERCVADLVRAAGDGRSAVRYAYFLTEVNVAAKDLIRGGAFDADSPQPDGVWLPEARKAPFDDAGARDAYCDARAAGFPDDLPDGFALEPYPASVLVLNDLNPFLRLGAGRFVVRRGRAGEGGEGRGAGGAVAGGERGLADWLADESCAECGCFPCEHPAGPLPDPDCIEVCAGGCWAAWEDAYKRCASQTQGSPEQCREKADEAFEECAGSCFEECTPPRSRCGCPPEEGERSDCVFLPYRGYRLTVTTRTEENPAPLGDRDVVCPDEDELAELPAETHTYYFKTQGPPLDLAPYVHEVVPASPSTPLLRRYQPAVRFKKHHVAELYTLPGRGGVRACGGEHGLTVRLLDASRNLVAECRGVFGTAADHVEPLYDGSGVPGPDAVFLEYHPELTELYRDDVLHIDCDWRAYFPGERHIVQVVWGDPEGLAIDQRFALGALAAGGPPGDRYDRPPYNGERPASGEVVLFEFPVLASRFESLDALVRTFEDTTCPPAACAGGGGVYHGTYFELEIPEDGNWEAAAEVLSELPDVESIADRLAIRLRDAHPTVTPREVDDQTLGVWISRVQRLLECCDREPGEPCADGLVIACSELLGWATLDAVRDAWELERSAFERIDKLLRLERHREPLPEGLELSVLVRDGDWVGFLLEFPEPLDFGRIGSLTLRRDGVGVYLRALKNAAGTRLFLFDPGAGGAEPLDAGEWQITLDLRGELAGWRTPALRGLLFPEMPTICFRLGTDLFGAPCPGR